MHRIGGATLRPRPGHTGSFHVDLSWGDPVPLPSETDSGAIEAGRVSVSFLGRLDHVDAAAMFFLNATDPDTIKLTRAAL